jgi:hypothetical protein
MDKQTTVTVCNRVLFSTERTKSLRHPTALVNLKITVLSKRTHAKNKSECYRIRIIGHFRKCKLTYRNR